MRAMAHRRAGTAVVVSPNAVERTVTRREPGSRPEREIGFPRGRAAAAPRCDLRPQAIPPDDSRSWPDAYQVWGLTKTDAEWLTALETALTATRRQDLKHGTNAAYVAGCVCKECPEHQRQRMSRQRI
jgi:hypothetical protein